MNATRRLDILAIIGGILAVAAIVIPIPVSRSFDVPKDQGRETAIHGMPDTDLRADFELLTEWPWDKDALPKAEKIWNSKGWDSGRNNGEYEKQKRIHMLPVLADAVRRFPDSARIQFRLGTLGDEKQRMAAMRKAADLDKENAYPLYALAGIYAADGKYDQALQLLSQGNLRPYATWCPIPYEGHSGSMFPDTLVSIANSTAQHPALSSARRTASLLSKHADKLRLSGDNERALAVSDQIRRMGWKLIREGDSNSIDVLVGAVVVKIAEKPEKLIFTATGNKAGLARIERDEKELTRLKAGARAYTDISMDKLMLRVMRFGGLAWAFSVATTGQAVVLLVFSIWWLVLKLRSRGQLASELHQSATDKAFPAARLVRMGALVLLTMVALSCIPVIVSNELLMLSLAVLTVVPVVLVIGVALWAAVIYRRAYTTDDESAARPWKGYPIADKRERQRRLTGVMAGVMIALAVWGVVLSAYMKMTMSAYPWQMDQATAGLCQEETKYVRDLVSGKIKVPEKYLKDAAKK